MGTQIYVPVRTGQTEARSFDWMGELTCAGVKVTISCQVIRVRITSIILNILQSDLRKTRM